MSYGAILAAAAASWGFGALWYGVLGDPWLRALGTTREALMGPSGRPSPAPFALSFVAEIAMAAVLAFAMARLGMTTVASGLAAGLLAWLGFVLTTMAVNNAYTRRNPRLTAIDGGHWLGVLLIQGCVLGAFA